MFAEKTVTRSYAPFVLLVCSHRSQTMSWGARFGDAEFGFELVGENGRGDIETFFSDDANLDDFYDEPRRKVRERRAETKDGARKSSPVFRFFPPLVSSAETALLTELLANPPAREREKPNRTDARRKEA